MNPQPLFDWINERHAIYQRREAGKPWPWTSDPILQQYRFCNVFRELDKVTVWIRENIREPFAKHENLWFMLCIARQINHPTSLAELIDKEADMVRKHKASGVWPEGMVWNAEDAASILDNRKARGLQVYTGAYMIRAESDPKQPWYSWSKQLYMTKIVLGEVWEHRESFNKMWQPGFTPHLQRVHAWFTQHYGWGGFMSYEVVTDLRHTRYLRNAPDIMTWANAGPGALRGLNRLAGRPLNQPLKQSVACAEMRHLLEISPKFVGSHVPALEIRDIEHSLCETDKYLRVKNGEGRPRSKYQAPR